MPLPPPGRGGTSVRVGFAILLVVAALVACAGTAAATPLLAHAEVVSTSPAAGARLSRGPQAVMIRLTEPVTVVEGGLRLTRADPGGGTVAVGSPRVTGDEVRWPVPGELAEGSYLVRWRVVSDDGHPVTGSFTFGVGVQPRPAPSTAPRAASAWPVVVCRWAGDLSFAVVTGFLVFTWRCWPEGRDRRRGRRLLLGALVSGIAASVLGLLLQGPYGAELAPYRLLEHDLMSEVAHTDFGAWMQLRIYCYLAMTGVLCVRGALDSALNRWLAALASLAVAVTFSGTGHAASSGRLLDSIVITLHVLCAGVWVGGLVTVVVLSAGGRDRPGLSALLRFSPVALASVSVLLLTGVLNAVLRLRTPDDLVTSGYGLLLIAKTALVVAALAAAVGSRRLLRAGEPPLSTVRLEAAATAAVLGVSAVLALTAPHVG